MVQRQVFATTTILTGVTIALEDVLPIKHHATSVRQVHIAIKPDNAGCCKTAGYTPKGCFTLGDELSLVGVHQQKGFVNAANGKGRKVCIQH